MNIGINLPTQLPLLAGELDAILACGVGHYLVYLSPDTAAAWRPILAQIRTANPQAHIHVRVEARGPLDANADAVALHEVATALPGLIGTIRIRNEPNVESDGTPQQWRVYLLALAGRLAAIAVGLPVWIPAPSPGVPNWQQFLAASAGIAGFAGHDLHAYGQPGNVLAIVDIARGLVSGPLLVSEYNFGAGNRFDIDQYAHDIPVVFAGLEARGIPGCIFVWRWKEPDVTLPTTLDIGAMPSVQNAIKRYTQGATVPTIPDRYPHATWIGSPNHWPDRAGQRILALVNHIADGPQSAIDSHFQDTAPGGNPDDAVSAHFAVNVDGMVHQYVGLNAAAWANGIIEPGATLPAAFPSGVNCNRLTVSIEHAGMSGQPIPEAQYQGSLALHVWLVEQIRASGQAFAVTTDTIIGHNRISPVTRAHCPGTAFPFARLLKDVAMIVDPAPTPYSIGLGFTQFLKDHPDYGVPRQDEWSDVWGNTFVWLTATPAHPKGPLLVWRKSTVTVDTAFAG